MATSSARFLLERMGIYSTQRGPVATLAPRHIAIHDQELDRPLPVTEFVFNGDTPPDRGVTVEPWPHGEIPAE